MKIITMFKTLPLQKLVIFLSLTITLAACATDANVYKAYAGDERANLQVSRVDGDRYIRTDWINRYVDKVRFLAVDGISIENPEEFDSLQIAPGYHDLRVYYSWDLGSQRGLAPALVSFAASRENVSRTLRFNALASERYTVKANPVFNSQRLDITELLYVDFWIEDREGNEIVSREEGRYVPVVENN